jgi:hypothetical protein
VYDATQHVPLLAAGPGSRGKALAAVARRGRRAALLGSAAAGAAGRRSARRLEARAAWVETLATQLDMGWSPLLGVRTAQHKYIRAPEPELYDLAADPRELTNRAALEPERAAELDRLVEERAAGRPVVPSYRLDAAERAQLEALGYAGRARASRSRPRTRRRSDLKGSAKHLQLDAVLALNERRMRSPPTTASRGLAFGRADRANAALLAGDVERAEREARAGS